jgi:hydroxymethylglutaryl-CoA reductase
MARHHGALGAKITGAGGGGAVIALCDGNPDVISEAFRAAGYQSFSTSFEKQR